MRRTAVALADSGPVVILAGIAAAGSFTHIRDTATEHGQGGWMAWAVAVCIDLTCVMAARERQRDTRTGRRTARLSWPTGVLIGGILLSLAANLAQADPTVWGWITAGTPAAAFLVAVSMLERRASGRAPSPSSDASSPVPSRSPAVLAESSVPARSSSVRSGSPAGPSSPWVRWDETRPDTEPAVADARPADLGQDERDDVEASAQTEIPVPASASTSPVPPSSASVASSPAAELVEFARRVATEHHTTHGRPITRDALRARLGVSNQLASDLLRHLRTETASA